MTVQCSHWRAQRRSGITLGGNNSWEETNALRVSPAAAPYRARTSCPGRLHSSSSSLLFFLVPLADALLELGQHGLEIEFLAFLLTGRGLVLGSGPCGGDLGRQQGGTGFGFGGRPVLGGALYLEVKVDLGAQTKRYRVHGCQVRRVPVGT